MDSIYSDLSRTNGYSVAIRSEIGDRSSQQDCAFVHGSDRRLLVAVCDGMGGTVNGGLASKRAISVFRNMLSDQKNYELAFNHPVEFYRKVLAKSDEAVSCDANLRGSGTTLTSLLLNGQQAYWASVGDSRLYILREGEILQATRDHNYRLYLEELASLGRIDKCRYLTELQRGDALISYIGIGKIRLLDLAQQPFRVCSGDMFILTSDGLTRLLDDAEIRDILISKQPLEQCADELMEAALDKRQSRAMDNTTFVLVRII